MDIFRKVSEFVYKNKGWFDEILGTSNVEVKIYIHQKILST
ncbi:hypothetical protein ACI7YW_09445 [Clostridium ljungdahlii]